MGGAGVYAAGVDAPESGAEAASAVAEPCAARRAGRKELNLSDRSGGNDLRM